jgi:hypothetical protein
VILGRGLDRFFCLLQFLYVVYIPLLIIAAHAISDRISEAVIADDDHRARPRDHGRRGSTLEDSNARG